jgi:Arc/MetJ-type ribon-helix-helix transcriptional regulator
MQAASLQLGVGRGRVVNKSDIVREGVEKFLAELGL